MSIRVMSWVWENGPAAPADRLVLLALADFCDDAGRCWPSMASIGAKACMTERGARGVVRRLEADGWVEVEVGGGRGGCSQYRVRMQKPEPETGKEKPGMPNPEPGAQNPERGDTKPGTGLHKTRNGGSAEPSRTIKEPSGNRREARACALPPDWALNDRNIENAEKAGFTAEEIEHEARAFHDHHLAKGSRFVDWDAAWRTWLQRSRQFGRASPAQRGGGRGMVAALRARGGGAL